MRYAYLLFCLGLMSNGVFPCREILKRYPQECQLSDDYQRIHKKTYDKYGINIEYLTGYRARRLIDEKVWQNEQDRIRCRPEKAYLPDPDVWLNWEKGANFLSDKLLDERLKDESLTIDQNFIKDINIQSVNINIMGLMATKVKGAAPGRIRQSSHEVPGFTYNCLSQTVTNENINNIKNFDLKDKAGNPLVSAIGHGCPDGKHQQGVIKYTATSNVEPQLKELMKYIQSHLDLYKKGKNRPDYGPLKFIADVQRWFVAIHPFGDGNGRTSRFLQDYLLAKFGLPYAPSGKLQDDVLLTKEGYQELFGKEIKESVLELEKCHQEFAEVGLESLDAISCNCRPMYFAERPYPRAVQLESRAKRGHGCTENFPMFNSGLIQENEEFMFNIIFSLENDSF